jgi:hypothetical protein
VILASTSDTIRIITDAAVTVDVFGAFIDKNGTTFTPANQATAIASASTTTVITQPGASTQRKITSLSIRNKHASLGVNVTVQFFNGSTAFEIVKRALAAGDTLTYNNNDGWELVGTGALVTRQTFMVAGAGTYTTPVGVRAIKVECIGGGGAGGSVATAATNSAAAGGGGAGAYSESMIANPASSYPYVVGAGGTPGAAGANNGGAGVDTTFNATTIVAKGGAGGLADTVAAIHVGGLGGAGGLASAGTGDFKGDGMSGGVGLALAAAQAVSGCGASSVYGGGGIERKNSTGAGTAGTVGGGGSGGSIISGGASQAGGAGGPGMIIVTEYR